MRRGYVREKIRASHNPRALRNVDLNALYEKLLRLFYHPGTPEAEKANAQARLESMESKYKYDRAAVWARLQAQSGQPGRSDYRKKGPYWTREDMQREFERQRREQEEKWRRARAEQEEKWKRAREEQEERERQKDRLFRAEAKRFPWPDARSLGWWSADLEDYGIRYKDVDTGLTVLCEGFEGRFSIQLIFPVGAKYVAKHPELDREVSAYLFNNMSRQEAVDVLKEILEHLRWVKAAANPRRSS